MRALVVALALAGCGNALPQLDDGGIPADLARLRPDLAGAPVHWQWVQSPTKAHLHAAVSDANGTVFIVGDKGEIMLTTDGGKGLSEQASGTTRDLLGAFLVSAKEVIVVGRAGTILRTRDGGGSWLGETSNTTRDLHGVVQVNGDAWAFGDGGTIVHTTGDGTWHPVASPTPNDLLGAWVQSGAPRAAGRGGAVISFANGAFTVERTVTAADLFGGIGGASNLVFGNDGTLLDDGKPVTVGDFEPLYAAAFVPGPGCTVLVGGDGFTARRCGGALQLDAAGDPHDLYGVAAYGGEALAVGSYGTILRRDAW